MNDSCVQRFGSELLHQVRVGKVERQREVVNPLVAYVIVSCSDFENLEERNVLLKQALFRVRVVNV